MTRLPVVCAVAFGASAAGVAFGALMLASAATDSQPVTAALLMREAALPAAVGFGLPAALWGALAGRRLARRAQPDVFAFSTVGAGVGAATGLGPGVLVAGMELATGSPGEAWIGLALGAMMAAPGILFGASVGLALWYAVGARYASR